MWKEIIESKYGSWRSIDQDNSNMKESTWWTNLKKVCRNSTEGKWFNEHLSWKLSRGNRIIFWIDCWVEGRSLRE